MAGKYLFVPGLIAFISLSLIYSFFLPLNMALIGAIVAGLLTTITCWFYVAVILPRAAKFKKPKRKTTMMVAKRP